MFRSVGRRLPGEFIWKTFLWERPRARACVCVLCIIMNMTEDFQCVYCSANAVSIRDGLDTETGTESLLSHRRERERERARRRARETEREYYQPGTDGSHKCNYPVISKLLHFSSSHSTPNCLTLHKSFIPPHHSPPHKKKNLDRQQTCMKKKRPSGFMWCELNFKHMHIWILRRVKKEGKRKEVNKFTVCQSFSGIHCLAQ